MAKPAEQLSHHSYLKMKRRDFLKLAATTGISIALSQLKPTVLEVLAQAKDYVHICWLNGAGCTGCSISFAQAADPDIVELLCSITVGNSGLPIALPDWMYVIHPAAGTLGVDLIEEWIAHRGPGPKIMVVEGAVQNPGFCETGERDFRDWVKDCAAAADYIVAFGSCAAYGGIPHAKGNATGAMGVQDFLRQVGMGEKAKTVINLPRCPGHPDSLILTLASLIVGVVPKLDKYNRPLMFYGRNMHEELCPYRPFYDRGIFAEFGQSEQGCRFKIGCKGPIAWTDCALRKWNNGVTYCVEVGAPCIGCSEPDFPDGDTAPFFKELPTLPTILGIPVETWGKAFAGAAAIGAGIHLAKKIATRGKEEEEGGE